ncbi:MAG TPA: 3-phenylpropionate/cinnamic acid dioxygenase subunit beta [Pseudonocardia sp.]|nr:3-phenylpropionate/cinnamic acid dioxygenase subunit beta [Pseudonocardia sp.]
MTDHPVTDRPSLELLKEVEQTLYREARLLDTEQFETWVEMLAEDIHYYMPSVENRYRSDPTDTSKDPSRMAFYNDDIAMIRTRVARLRTGTAWSEDPPTRYTHLITNIEVELTDRPDEYRVYSNFYSYRNRNERDEDVLVGRREDLWRRDPEGRLVLAKRVITPTWSVLPGKNLNVFL